MSCIFSKSKTINFIIFLLSVFSIIARAGEPLEKVSLQLDWKYQFQYAGFIMAKEKGFYKDVGLDVELLEYEDSIDIVESVLSRQNNYGIYNSSVLISDGQIKPTILMATYYQKSPLIYVTQKNIKQPSDLVGKTIMGTADELKNSSLALMLDHFFVNKNNAVFHNHSFDIQEFADRKVDAMSAFRTNQLFELDKQNIEYNIIDPADYGFSMSAVNLFTSFSEALNNPDRTRKFIRASNKGWTYALAHPEEAIGIIYEQYSQQKSLEALAYEAEVTQKMMLVDFFDIGTTNKELSTRVVKQLQYSGLLSDDEKLGTFIFEDALREFGETVNFTEAQKVYLQNKKDITMCVDPNWMPFESVKNGKHIGITADVINKFRQQLPIPIRLIETDSWQESIVKAKQRQCDIFSLVAETPERLKYMDFTAPYIDLPIVLTTKMDTFFIDDIAQVKDKKIGIVKGYAIAEELRNKIPDFNIVDVPSIQDGLARVESGELYGYIDNLMVVANYIQKDFTGVLKISSRLDGNVSLAIGTRNDQPEVKEIFEILISNLKEEELQAIYNKWVAVKQEPNFDYSYAWKLLVIMILILSGYIFHYIKWKKLNDSLLTLSSTDKLTGLYNRVKTDELLLVNKASLDRYGIETAVILLDIDLFKDVNDKYGHLAGDKVLVEFSSILKQNVRSTDYACRWGGEEFIIVCPNINLTDAIKLAEKLLDNIRRYIFSEIGHMTASAGVTVMSKSMIIEDTVKDVDVALYRSKTNGRDQVSIASSSDGVID